jgi:hypothetical protein
MIAHPSRRTVIALASLLVAATLSAPSIALAANRLHAPIAKKVIRSDARVHRMDWPPRISSVHPRDHVDDPFASLLLE